MEKFTWKKDRSNNMFSWQVNDDLTKEEAVKYSAIIKNEISAMRFGVKLLVDNSNMTASGIPIVFKPEVNEVWTDLMGWLVTKCDKIFVLSNGATMSMQMNRLARSAGIERILKAAWYGDRERGLEEAYKYLEIENKELVGAK